MNSLTHEQIQKRISQLVQMYWDRIKYLDTVDPYLIPITSELKELAEKLQNFPQAQQNNVSSSEPTI